MALVGSGPGVLGNEPEFIDAYDIVVRVNNYRLGLEAGHRTDVFYSYFGNAIKKTAAELASDGVRLCLCKCPDAMPISSPWHMSRGQMQGVDFRWIYQMRARWWFCDTYIPDAEEFRRNFNLLNRHVPTTGFAAILDLLSWEPAELYLTGFDFFTSGLHNVSDPWRRKNLDDPIGHVPEAELQWLRTFRDYHPITIDSALEALLRREAA